VVVVAGRASIDHIRADTARSEGHDGHEGSEEVTAKARRTGDDHDDQKGEEEG
jgi:hypothetical protein